MKNIFKIGFIAVLWLPMLALAQQPDAFSVATKIVKSIGDIVKLLIPIVFTLAILGFFYGIMLYVFSKSGEGKIEGKNVMLWSLIALFVMVSLGGIIQLAQNTLGINGNAPAITVPTINGGTGSGGSSNSGALRLFP